MGQGPCQSITQSLPRSGVLYNGARFLSRHHTVITTIRDVVQWGKVLVRASVITTIRDVVQWGKVLVRASQLLSLSGVLYNGARFLSGHHTVITTIRGVVQWGKVPVRASLSHYHYQGCCTMGQGSCQGISYYHYQGCCTMGQGSCQGITVITTIRDVVQWGKVLVRASHSHYHYQGCCTMGQGPCQGITESLPLSGMLYNGARFLSGHHTVITTIRGVVQWGKVLVRAPHSHHHYQGCCTMGQCPCQGITVIIAISITQSSPLSQVLHNGAWSLSRHHTVIITNASITGAIHAIHSSHKISAHQQNAPVPCQNTFCYGYKNQHICLGRTQKQAISTSDAISVCLYQIRSS